MTYGVIFYVDIKIQNDSSSSCWFAGKHLKITIYSTTYFVLYELKLNFYNNVVMRPKCIEEKLVEHFTVFGEVLVIISVCIPMHIEYSTSGL